MAAPTAPSTAPPADNSPDRARDWSFARRPFWLFSHLFALSVVSLFVVLGVWQLNRMAERQDLNALIEERTAETLSLTTAPGAADDADNTDNADDADNTDDLDYRKVEASVVFVDEDFARVVNRSQGGVAGEHVVAIAELADGSAIAVNRGFVPSNADVTLEPLPDGATVVSGWLRATVEQGRIGATDTGSGNRLPRLDTERLADRLGRPLPSVWIQVAPDETGGLATFPDPFPLPPLNDGPHLSYAVQWFIFATLGVAFYGALVWRRASGSRFVMATPAEIVDP